jgi:hypothetical protein
MDNIESGKQYDTSDSMNALVQSTLGSLSQIIDYFNWSDNNNQFNEFHNFDDYSTAYSNLSNACASFQKLVNNLNSL